MKKYFIFALCAILSIGVITGCGSKKEDKKETENNEKTEEKTKKVIGCDECVFGYPRYAKIGDTISDDYRKTNYMELESYPGFAGYILSDEGIITRAFSCGIADGQAFCIEGATDGSKYEANKKILIDIFGEEDCNENSEVFTCDGLKYGSGGISIYKKDYVHIYGCSVSDKGEINCF